MVNYTAKYTKIPSGYMGQLVEWPEIVTEGKDLEDCRAMLRDALKEMMLAYEQLGMELPLGNALIEQLPIEVQHVGQTAGPHFFPNRHCGNQQGAEKRTKTGPHPGRSLIQQPTSGSNAGKHGRPSTPYSDVDVLVEFEADARVGMIGLSALEMELSQILGRKVDLNTPGFLSKYYRERILSEAEVQYDAAGPNRAKENESYMWQPPSPQAMRFFRSHPESGNKIRLIL